MLTRSPLGVRWPAEWEPHAATWIAWPHNEEDWPGKFGPIPWVYADIVRHLSRAELVHILVRDPAMQQEVAKLLQKVGVDGRQVRLHQIPTDRVWTRDYGPIFVFVEENQPGQHKTKWATKGRFNAWAKYDNWQRDDAAGTHMAQLVGVPISPIVWRDQPIVLEGGSIDGNGAGTLLTTEECLLSSEIQCRNPGLSRQEWEQVLAQHLGIKKVLWLGRGLVGDDTHGHIDDLARFTDPTTVVTVVEADKGDENYDPLAENWERLQSMTTQDGQPLRVVPLQMPAPIVFDGQRLPLSYANFYLANDLVLVPTFNDERDRQALATLAELFPNRRVVGIHSGDLIYGLGALHCMTQQEPL